MKVIQASSQKEMQSFNSFPLRIYGRSFRAPAFPLAGNRGSMPDLLYARVEAQPFLALRNGYVVGRIVASTHQILSAGKEGFFGYFEAVEDQDVAAALVKAASFWLAARGIDKMIGPVDLTPHERLGLLAEGFGGRHQPGMPYNPSYYVGLLDRCGLVEEMNLYAYYFDLRKPFPQRLVRVAGRAGRIRGMRLREINFADPAAEGKMLSQIHNSTMSEVWGFVPLSPEEGSATWQRLKGFYDPGLILAAEVDGSPAGLCLTLSPAGSLPFFGLRGMLSARLAVLAVLPGFRFKGLEAALILECARRALRKGISILELSQVAENNYMMNGIIQSLEGVKKTRVYRIYRTPANMSAGSEC